MTSIRAVGHATRALALLAVIAIGVPLLLGQLSVWRFGSAVPWAGISWPSGESLTGWGGSLAGRVTDEMIVDLTVRAAVLLGWVCVVLLLVSLAGEMWHLWRHGSPRPAEGRGPQWSRRLVRSVAAGLVMMVPVAGSTVGALGPSGAQVAAFSESVSERGLADMHVVRAGDTLWEIAELRLGDPLRWGEIWSINRDRAMPDGRVFDDPHVIIPGWELQLPPGGPTAVGPARIAGDVGAARSERSAPSVASPVEVRSGTGTPRRDPPGGRYLGADVLSDVDIGHGRGSGAAMMGPGVPDADPPPAIDPLPETDPEMFEEGAASEGEFDPFPERSSVGGILVGVAGATMLATGLLIGVAGRRRSRLRASTAATRPPLLDRLLVDRSSGDHRAPEDPAELLEGEDLGGQAGGAILDDLRQAADAERILRLDLVLRLVSTPLMVVDQAISAVLVDPRGTVEILTTAPVDLEPPFRGTGRRWVVTADVDLEELIDAAAEIAQPSPALIHLGNAVDGREVYVDLEVIGVLSLVSPGAAQGIERRGPTSDPELAAVLRAVQMMLVHSPFSQDLRSLWVGEGSPVWPEEAGGSGGCSVEVSEDFAAAERWCAAPDLRAGELRVLLVATPHELDLAPAWIWERDLIVVGGGLTPATGAMLSRHGDGWVLSGPVMDGEEIMITPVGVSAAEAEELLDLVETETARESLVYQVEPPAHGVEPSSAPAATMTLLDAVQQSAGVGITEGIMVRVMGPVDVVNPRGETARFTRSKSLELLAWCVTHRNRSTRGAARTALWESDVRDSTFANIVSEARRATTRLEQPPPERQWVCRTLTEELVLDAAVTSDVEIMRATLRRVDREGIENQVSAAEQAVGLIRGMPFEGTGYLWPEAEGISSDLIQMATSLAATLATHHLDRGDVAGVFRATGAGLLALPGHEELIALRMRAHARVGDLAGVKQEWAAYQRVIARDPWSSGEPAPKLRELSAQLLGQT